MLLWALILTPCLGAAVALFGANLPRYAAARACSPSRRWIGVGFLAFLLFTSNPFERLSAGAAMDGNGLNPLLQDPGLAIHPPLLYLGYVGFSVTFAFAIAALHRRPRSTPAWARWVRPWTLGRLDASSPLGIAHRLVLGLLRCSAGAAGGSGIRSRTPPSCPGSPARRCCTPPS